MGESPQRTGQGGGTLTQQVVRNLQQPGVEVQPPRKTRPNSRETYWFPDRREANRRFGTVCAGVSL